MSTSPSTSRSASHSPPMHASAKQNKPTCTQSWSANVPIAGYFNTFQTNTTNEKPRAKRSKPRRTNRACLRCRKAKVRCIRVPGQFGRRGKNLVEASCERCSRRGSCCEYDDLDGDGGVIRGMDAHAALMDSVSRIRSTEIPASLSYLTTRRPSSSSTSSLYDYDYDAQILPHRAIRHASHYPHQNGAVFPAASAAFPEIHGSPGDSNSNSSSSSLRSSPYPTPNLHLPASVPHRSSAIAPPSLPAFNSNSASSSFELDYVAAAGPGLGYDSHSVPYQQREQQQQFYAPVARAPRYVHSISPM
ncbi:Zn(2)-C6 fungal-type domain-containing protein [Mycena kentingensis (nom. inval.)]|nr:Zn(2)-C6 fungal-type domain-containing protein [Mycena kentingensis (nom. inval.)]